MVFPAFATEITPHPPTRSLAPKEAKPFDQQVFVLKDRVVKMGSAASKQLEGLGEKYHDIRDRALEQIHLLAREYNAQTENVLTALEFNRGHNNAMGNDVSSESDAQSSRDSTVPSSGKLIKIRHSGEIEERPAWVRTDNLATENESLVRGTNLKKGITDVRLDGPKVIPAGKYFIKQELDNDNTPFGDSDNPVPIESRQLLRYQRLKEAGAKVPGTFRKYIEKGEGYFVMTDLTFGGKNWVWGVTDEWRYHEVPKQLNVEQINWDQLAEDLVTNSSCATKANVLANCDAHIISGPIISGPDGQTTEDYLADLDKQTWLYPEEAKFFDKGDIEISNLGEAGKALVRFIQDTGQQSKMAEYFSLFWAKTKQIYGTDRAKILSQDLLNKSTITIGLEDSEIKIIKNVLIESEKIV